MAYEDAKHKPNITHLHTAATQPPLFNTRTNYQIHFPSSGLQWPQPDQGSELSAETTLTYHRLEVKDEAQTALYKDPVLTAQ